MAINCLAPNCSEQSRKCGYCAMHYERLKRSDRLDPTPKRYPICLYCGQVNERANPRAMYCSRQCAVDAANQLKSERARKNRENKLCPVCSTPVDSNAYQALYCSRTCKSKAADTRRRLKKVGTTQEEYERLLVIQENSCAICRSIHWGSPNVPRLDHDHATGKLRGLLCNACNLALGLLGDDLNIIESAAQYMRDHCGNDYS